MATVADGDRRGIVAGPLPAGKPASAREAKVPRTLLNFWLDAGLFLALVFVLWVSIVMQVVFPPPTVADGWRLWGLSFNQWRDAQFYGLCTVALLALEHLVLHWNWVCGVIGTKVLRLKQRPDEANQAVYGVGAFIMILLTLMGIIVAAMWSVQAPRL